MTHVKPRPWWSALLVYAAGGAAIGWALPTLKTLGAAHFGRSGLAVAAVVNVAMPLLVVTLAAIYPKLWIALLGTFAATIAFLALGGQYFPRFGEGWLYIFVQQMRPVLVVARVAYHVLAGITVLAVQPVRRVGTPPDPRRCTTCGYLLVGLSEPRCPECATAFHAEKGPAPPSHAD
jgi:hypothetical protein